MINRNSEQAAMEKIQQYITTLQQTMDQLPQTLIAEVIGVLQRARLQGNQVFILGNGVSTCPISASLD